MVVHSVLPELVTAAVAEVLDAAGIEHVAQGDHDVMAAAEVAAHDGDALIGPFLSRAVAHAVEATAPAGVPLIAPVATWAGATRDDEPGCEDDPANHRGTVLRMVAGDTVVGARIAAHVRAEGKRALVIAGDHEYGVQLDGQLRLADLPGAQADGADVVVLCGLAGHPEVERARQTGLPILAFDGVQTSDLGDVAMALPFAPVGDEPFDHLVYGAQLVVEAGGDLTALRAAGRFDEHGDPIDPPVWLWRADGYWTLRPERPL
jgi:hypothetical protein